MYKEFSKQMGYTLEYKDCIEKCVSDLITTTTSENHPGMLLGKIQSGKTRTFLGIIALAFDEAFDVVIVMTKGTNALAVQTVKRIKRDFKCWVKEDEVQVYDVMQAPELTEWTIEESKQIIICKKEDDNLGRLDRLLFEDYNGTLGKKRVLLIDDEADFGSISMRKIKGEVSGGVLWHLIDDIRNKLKSPAFLQVTATPYSLYLQPEEATIDDYVFRPTKPAFTHLVPVHDKYIGGDFYFRESEDENSVAYHLHQMVHETEMERLFSRDKRAVKFESILTTPTVEMLRTSLATFVAGGAIRRLQSNKKLKFSFLLHVNINKSGHDWQQEVVTHLVNEMKQQSNAGIVTKLFESSYENLKTSIQLDGGIIPEWNEFIGLCFKLLTGLSVSLVNSDGDMAKLLDEDTGELQLRNPLNIFIGGFILDRGLTIPNVIGFLYGRNPKKFQQDTVLQHARMYGARPKEDLAITRFYTTGRVYKIMKQIHEMDSSLREAFEKGHDKGIVFIHRDKSGTIKPCSPNKVLLSDMLSLKPHSTRVPFGFQTGYANHIMPIIKNIDQELDIITDKEMLVDIDKVADILRQVRKSMFFTEKEYKRVKGQVPGCFTEDGYSWDVEADIEAIRFASPKNTSHPNYGKMWVIVRRDRKRNRIRSCGRLENSPITGSAEGNLSATLAIDVCSVILTRQEGSKENGWLGTPFWWPVIRFPKNMKPVIFTPTKEK